MTKQDFSHFKYYEKRLKEMGFRDASANDVDEDPYVLLQKQIEGREYYVRLVDYSGYDKNDFPHIKLNLFRSRYDTKGLVFVYKIGFDKDFQENIKPICENQGEIINEYPTWRSAFNQLVKDYHELEKNTQRGNFFIT